jgi:hypothetical protein
MKFAHPHFRTTDSCANITEFSTSNPGKFDIIWRGMKNKIFQYRTRNPETRAAVAEVGGIKAHHDSVSNRRIKCFIVYDSCISPHWSIQILHSPFRRQFLQGRVRDAKKRGTRDFQEAHIRRRFRNTCRSPRYIETEYEQVHCEHSLA